MPNRCWDAGDKYRYGFNGKENDDEVLSDAKFQDYGMRLYRPDLGRFVSVDPLAAEYPMLTPYQFASNRPVDGIDLDGLEYRDFLLGIDEQGRTVHKIVFHTYVIDEVSSLNLINFDFKAQVRSSEVQFLSSLSGVPTKDISGNTAERIVGNTVYIFVVTTTHSEKRDYGNTGKYQTIFRHDPDPLSRGGGGSILSDDRLFDQAEFSNTTVVGNKPDNAFLVSPSEVLSTMVHEWMHPVLRSHPWNTGDCMNDTYLEALKGSAEAIKALSQNPMNSDENPTSDLRSNHIGSQGTVLTDCQVGRLAQEIPDTDLTPCPTLNAKPIQPVKQ